MSKLNKSQVSQCTVSKNVCIFLRLIFDSCSFRPWVILITWSYWVKARLEKLSWWRRRPQGCTMPWKSSAKKSLLLKLVFTTRFMMLVWTLIIFSCYVLLICLGWSGPYSYRKQSTSKYTASLFNSKSASRQNLRKVTLVFIENIVTSLFLFLQTLKYAFQTNDRLCFVMEYANGGEV